MNAPLFGSHTIVPLWIDGTPVRGADEAVLPVFNPADPAREVGRCYRLSAHEVPAVLRAAERGFARVRQSSPAERCAMLSRLAEALHAQAEPLAMLIVREAGKPITLARAEVARAIALCRAYADEPALAQDRLYRLEGREALVRRVPLGPVLAITPFNFPLNLVMHKLAPAIAAGNAVVIKPASTTPLTALALARLVVEAGYDAISVVPCAADVAEMLVSSDVFAKLSFTGSAAVGWRLKTLCGRAAVTLELGGSAACMIHDIEPDQYHAVAQRVAQGAFWYAGQICISVQRILIQQRHAEAMTAALIEAARAMRVGDPMDPQTDVGPLITPEDFFRTRQLIKSALGEGANALYGGNSYNTYTMNPCLLNRIRPEAAINQQEAFAPLATIMTYDGFDEGLALVNHSPYGLQAGVYTRHAAQARQAFDVLDVGGVIINDVPTLRLDYLPYGGVKASGLGREGVLCGVDGMTTLKTLIAPPPSMA